MEDSKQVVNLNVEPPPVIDRTPPVQEVAIEAEPSNETPIVPEHSPIPTVPAVHLDVDEFGVPWKNRAMEWKRKSEDLVDKLPQMIDEKLSKVTQPQAPQYTYEQLEAYKLQNAADAQIVSWATGEQRKMQAAENKKLFEEVVGTRDKVSKTEILKERSLIKVQKEYPEAFQRDANGVAMGWDLNNALTQELFGIMKDPRFSNDPEGLVAAAEMAYGRVSRKQAPVLQKKVEQAKADVKQAQKATLTEGAGRRVTLSEPPQQVALNTLKKTGLLKDAENAMGALLRQRGIIGE